jgi:hypothetical protein
VRVPQSLAALDPELVELRADERERGLDQLLAEGEIPDRPRSRSSNSCGRISAQRTFLGASRRAAVSGSEEVA